MKFCTMCGERCADDQIIAHIESHQRTTYDDPQHRPVPALSCREAFQRAFSREPSPAELDQMVAGNAEAVFEAASAALS
jgi:hypothetical protein